MNQGTIAGHLGADPETRFTPGGQKVTNLRVGCKARKDETIWWRVTVWGDQFDKMMPYFKKGSAIIVHGEIQKPDVYTDKEGKTRVSLQMTATQLLFNPFGKKEDGKPSEGRKQEYTEQPVDEEIPF